MTPLRTRLRSDTQYDHDRIDALYGRYDLTDRADLSAFLEAHALALSWCTDAIPADRSEFSALMRGLIAAIGDDLAHLGAPAQSHWPAKPNALRGDALGLIYVVAGSRLGGRVLVRQILAAEDPVVASATRYFTCTEGDALWQSVQVALQDWTGSSDQEARLVEGARSAFQYYEDAHFAVQGLQSRNDYEYRVA
ncbi:MAG: biliverdin-producing heme oxygenase [Henriciella sp.]